MIKKKQFKPANINTCINGHSHIVYFTKDCPLCEALRSAERWQSYYEIDQEELQWYQEQTKTGKLVLRKYYELKKKKKKKKKKVRQSKSKKSITTNIYKDEWPKKKEIRKIVKKIINKE